MYFSVPAELSQNNVTFAAGEIVAQVMHVQRTFRRSVSLGTASHIVGHGIGEPFDNYDNVISSLKVANSDKDFAIGAFAISLYLLGRFGSKDSRVRRRRDCANLHCLHAPDNDTFSYHAYQP